MRTFKSLLGAKAPNSGAVVDPRRDSHRILVEYILNMAVSCLAHGEVTPLYEQYMEDARLSDEDRDELARAFLLMQMASVAPEDTEETAADPG